MIFWNLYQLEERTAGSCVEPQSQSMVLSPTAFLPAEAVGSLKEKTGRQRTAAYIRVSTDMADQENSYETQENYFRQLLEQNAEWISVGIYSDYGISGTSCEKRTGFRRILRHCREGKIDRIICKSISRFARNTRDFIEALNTLHEAGVTILFEKEGVDTADSASNFILTTLAAIAQEESRSISSNLRWSNEKRFPRGEVPNRAIYGYRFTGERMTMKSGYTYRAVEIVPEEAEVVRWIFRQAAEGNTYKAIARELNCRHIPCKVSSYTQKRKEYSAKGQLNSNLDEGWTDAQISDMVRNERYIGDVLIQKTYTKDYLTHKTKRNKGEVTQYLVKNHHPAIIDRGLFEEVKKGREKCRGAEQAARVPHTLSGRLICGCCGRFYHVRNSRCHPIWFCPSTSRNNGINFCSNEKVYEEQIIRMFRRAVMDRFCLTAVPITDAVDAADIMSGQYEGNSVWSDSASFFVKQMLSRLENIQRTDFMEHDCALMRRRIIEANKMAGEAAEAETRKVSERLEYFESYWEELEADYECREQAIAWMKRLPSGKAGTEAFLNGITSNYVRAFVLSVVISDPLHYTVHWFDDTRTEVEMYSNVRDYRRTTNNLGNRQMNNKHSRKKV